jgi:cation diffusion facilitator family transporter
MAGHESSTKAIYYALLANLGIAICKGIAAIITQSGSLLAETIHSFADCGNQILLLFGMKKAQIPPDENHPLGHGKDEYFWSFIVAMLLFSMGGLYSIYEGIHKLHATEPIQKVWIALGVLGVSVILEASSLIGAISEVRHIKQGKTFRHWLKNTRNSELIVVLGEDIAAVLGLITASVFVALAHFLNNPLFDAIGSICIGAILLVVSFFLIIRMKDLLIGKSADPETQATIRELIQSDPHIDEIFNIITVQYGPYIMLACKIKMNGKPHIRAACESINALERNLKKQIPEIKWSFIEPDIVI